MNYTYEKAQEMCKAGVPMTRPAWPGGQHITWNAVISEFHPEPSIDFVDEAGVIMSFSPADFDELAKDWKEYIQHI